MPRRVPPFRRLLARVPAKREAWGAWLDMRERAALHRGVLYVAPVFWASFCVFVNAAWGLAGFLLHACACLPRRPAHALVLLAAFPLFSLWFAARAPYLSRPPAPFHEVYAADTTHVAREGVIAGIPVASARGWTFPFRARGGRDDGLLFRATLESGEPPRRGARGILTGRAYPEEAPPNPGQLDMRRVLRGQGAAASLRAVMWNETRRPTCPARALSRARDTLGAILVRRVPAPARPLPEAALLNITENVPFATRDAFYRSGMQHVLAISGQHLGLLIGVVMLASLCARVPRKAAVIVATLLAAAYIPLVGSPVSVVRSGIMLACLLPAVLRERPAAGLHALCLTAAVDLLLDPHNILNLGFQLSYAATLALLLGTRPAMRASLLLLRRGAEPGRLDALRVPLRAAVQMVVLSGLISLFTYPVLAASTHATTPWGILGNIATVPAGAAMLVGGLLSWIFDLALPVPLDGVASWAGASAGFCALLLEGLVFGLAALPGAVRPVADASAVWLAALVAACGAVVIALRAERFRLALLLAAVAIAAEVARPAVIRTLADEVRVTFLAVGHGDAALLELPGANILMDAGDSPGVARRVLIPFLRERGIARLDRVVVTHADRDHYGGLAALLKHVPASVIVAPAEPEGRSSTWDCLRATARARGIPWVEGRAGQSLYAGQGVSLWILAPDTSLAGGGKNDRSLVTLLRTPSGDALLAGDIEQAGQRAMAATWPLWRGASLKAPHHGSDRTTLPCFLRAASPGRAVVSCGGRRGFPGARTMETFAALNTPAAVTARDGAVTWRFPLRSDVVQGPGRGPRETRHLSPNLSPN